MLEFAIIKCSLKYSKNIYKTLNLFVSEYVDDKFKLHKKCQQSERERDTLTRTNIFKARLLDDLSVEMLVERWMQKGGKMGWAAKRAQIILECMLGKLMLLWCDPAEAGHSQQQ